MLRIVELPLSPWDVGCIGVGHQVTEVLERPCCDFFGSAGFVAGGRDEDSYLRDVLLRGVRVVHGVQERLNFLGVEPRKDVVQAGCRKRLTLWQLPSDTSEPVLLCLPEHLVVPVARRPRNGLRKTTSNFEALVEEVQFDGVVFEVGAVEISQNEAGLASKLVVHDVEVRVLPRNGHRSGVPVVKGTKDGVDRSVGNSRFRGRDLVAGVRPCHTCRRQIADGVVRGQELHYAPFSR